jgi:hypothetical protein
VQRGYGIGSFFRGLSRFVKTLLCSGAKAVGKEALRSDSNILTDLLKKEPDQHVGNILKSRAGEANTNLEHKIKNMTGAGLDLKIKRGKPHLQSKRKKVKHIFTEK